MDSRIIKIITHASTFFAPFLVPIVVLLLCSDRDVKNTAVQALIFHIVMTILVGISWILSFLLIGIPFLIVFGIMAIYYPVKGIIWVATDRPFHYPLMRSIH